jgi:hypothetical protein
MSHGLCALHGRRQFRSGHGVIVAESAAYREDASSGEKGNAIGDRPQVLPGLLACVPGGRPLQGW